MSYTSIRPGQVWLDTEGKRIQAHGGSVMYWQGDVLLVRRKQGKNRRPQRNLALGRALLPLERSDELARLRRNYPAAAGRSGFLAASGGQDGPAAYHL